MAYLHVHLQERKSVNGRNRYDVVKSRQREIDTHIALRVVASVAIMRVKNAMVPAPFHCNAKHRYKVRHV